MGYMTDYNFWIMDFETLQDLDEGTIQEVFSELNKKTEISEYDDTSFQATWYEMEDDMIEFSKKYPDYLFEITGEGEEGTLDVWKEYFHNGKKQYCAGTIVYDELNKNELI